MKIVHRDLKCANVFVTSDGKYKLGDLNVSKVAKQGLVYTQTGTPYYASPEVWKDQPYDQRSDIWSLGCVVYEMACLKPPFRANDMKSLYNRILKGAYDGLPKSYSKELSDIIASMLKVFVIELRSTPKTDRLAIKYCKIQKLSGKTQREVMTATINRRRNKNYCKLSKCLKICAT